MGNIQTLLAWQLAQLFFWTEIFIFDSLMSILCHEQFVSIHWFHWKKKHRWCNFIFNWYLLIKFYMRGRYIDFCLSDARHPIHTDKKYLNWHWHINSCLKTQQYIWMGFFRLLNVSWFKHNWDGQTWFLSCVTPFTLWSSFRSLFHNCLVLVGVSMEF